MNNVDLIQWSWNGTVSFELAVAECMPNVLSSDVQIISKTNGTFSSRRRLQSFTPYININYTVSFDSTALGYSSTSAAYATLSNQLQSSVLSGNFTRYLQTYGSSLGCTYLGNSSSSGVTIGPLVILQSAVPTALPAMVSTGKNDASMVSAEVVGGLVIIILLALGVIVAAVYYKFWHKKGALVEKWYEYQGRSINQTVRSPSPSMTISQSLAQSETEESESKQTEAEFDYESIVYNRERGKKNIKRLIKEKSIQKMLQKSTGKVDMRGEILKSNSRDAKISSKRSSPTGSFDFVNPIQGSKTSSPPPILHVPADELGKVKSESISFNDIYNGGSSFSAQPSYGQSMTGSKSRAGFFSYVNPIAISSNSTSASISTDKKFSANTKANTEFEGTMNYSDIYTCSGSFIGGNVNSKLHSVPESSKRKNFTPEPNDDTSLEAIYNFKDASYLQTSPAAESTTLFSKKESASYGTVNPIARHKSSPPTNRLAPDSQRLDYQNIYATKSNSLPDASKGSISFDIINPIADMRFVRIPTEKIIGKSLHYSGESSAQHSAISSASKVERTSVSSLNSLRFSNAHEKNIIEENLSGSVFHKPPTVRPSSVQVPPPSTMQKWMATKVGNRISSAPKPLPTQQGPAPRSRSCSSDSDDSGEHQQDDSSSRVPPSQSISLPPSDPSTYRGGIDDDDDDDDDVEKNKK